jgi:hypothetical protein
MANVWKRLAVNKQRMHRFHIEMFNLKKLNEVEGVMKSQLGCQLWKTLALKWVLTELGKLLLRITKFQRKKVLGYYELKKNKLWLDEGYSNYWIKENKPNCNGYRIQAT